MQENLDNEEIKKALIKRAVGYTAEEVVSEYSDDNGVMKMVRKKVSKKNVPPEVSALKLLLDDLKDDCLNTLSDDELVKEKDRLLSVLLATQSNKN